MRRAMLAVLLCPCAAFAAERLTPVEPPALPAAAMPPQASASLPEATVQLDAKVSLEAHHAVPFQSGAPADAALPRAAATIEPKAAATAAAPSPFARMEKVVQLIKDVFSQAKPVLKPNSSVAEAKYGEFLDQQPGYWKAVSGPFAEERIKFGALEKIERKQYLRDEGDKIVEKLKERHGATELGYHYNLHGGQGIDYVRSGYIFAKRGDIGELNRIGGRPKDEVFFFRSSKYSLLDVLDASHPDIMFFPSRMGHVLIIFKKDAPELAAALESGAITGEHEIAMAFDTAKLKGVPYSTFIMPPVEVFKDLKKKLGLKKSLTRDEETLAVMRFIEAAGLDPEKYIP
jgi:hypothetical protein